MTKANSTADTRRASFFRLAERHSTVPREVPTGVTTFLVLGRAARISRSGPP